MINFDLSKPITAYELIAIILSSVAIFIPIIKSIWNNYIIKGKLKFLPIGKIMLFFNQSGPYIRIDGVYEAINKSISIKNISAKVIRVKDENKLNFEWSSFISPINQNLIGNYLQTTEAAHPFRIEKNSIMCAFTEFCDSFDSFAKTFKIKSSCLFNKINTIKSTYMEYSLAKDYYQKSDEYIFVRKYIENNFFWEIGKYKIIILVKYNNTDEEKIIYNIFLNEYEQQMLISNIDEILLSPLKDAYGIRRNYYTSIIELN